MDDLRELYQEVILDHSRKPRNLRAIAHARRAEGFNALCGDRVTIFLHLEGDTVADVSFQGSGCAISTAAASTLTETLKGRPVAEAERLYHAFHKMVTEGELPADAPDMGKLAAFAGVAEFPMRVKCATLAWHTMEAALHGKGEDGEIVSTEDD